MADIPSHQLLAMYESDRRDEDVHIAGRPALGLKKRHDTTEHARRRVVEAEDDQWLEHHFHSSEFARLVPGAFDADPELGHVEERGRQDSPAWVKAASFSRALDLISRPPRPAASRRNDVSRQAISEGAATVETAP